MWNGFLIVSKVEYCNNKSDEMQDNFSNIVILKKHEITCIIRDEAMVLASLLLLYGSLTLMVIFLNFVHTIWCRDKCIDIFVVVIVHLFSSTVILKPKCCYANDLRCGLLTSFVRKIVCLESNAEWSSLDYMFFISMTSLIFY